MKGHLRHLQEWRHQGRVAGCQAFGRRRHRGGVVRALHPPAQVLVGFVRGRPYGRAHRARRDDLHEGDRRRHPPSCGRPLRQARSTRTSRSIFYRALGGQDKTQGGNKRINYLKIQMKNVVVSSVGRTSSRVPNCRPRPSACATRPCSGRTTKPPIDGVAPAKNSNVQGMWNLKTNEVAFAA